MCVSVRCLDVACGREVRLTLLADRLSLHRSWLRARPVDQGECPPFLKLPGSNQMRTLPDGLWLYFAGSPEEPFVDIFAIEACCTLQNLLDKRSRFAPSTQSLLAVCPLPWLLAETSSDDPCPRWQRTGVLLAEPTAALIVPVRDWRVMYGLPKTHYRRFALSQVPHPHEYFVPIDSLTAENSHTNPGLQRLVALGSISANFFHPE